MNYPSIQASELNWTDAGTDTDAKARLLCTVVIAGVSMHLEAYAIWRDESPSGAMAWGFDCDEWNEDLDAVALGLSMERPRGIYIGGREYVLIASPHNE